MNSPEAQPVSDTERDTASQAALECYLSSILDIADLVAAVFPELGATCHEQLNRLRARLSFEANQKTLEESRDTLHQILEAFRGNARHYTQALEEELNQTLGLVAQAEEKRSTRNVRHVEHLVDFVDQMEQAVRAGDLDHLRRQTVELRGFAESIELDTRDALAQMRDQMREFQHRLREAELLASLDPLTGLPNRREFNRATRRAHRRTDRSFASCCSIWMASRVQRPLRPSVRRRNPEAIGRAPQQPDPHSRFRVPLGRR